MIEKEFSLNQLYRSQTNKVFAGVCGGIGEFFSVDPTIVRIAFLLSFLIGGFGLLLYVLLWILMPVRENPVSHIRGKIQNMTREMGETVDTIFNNTPARYSSNQNTWIAGLLIVFGVFFLLKNFNFLYFLRLDRWWPLLLILLGGYLLYKKK